MAKAEVSKLAAQRAMETTAHTVDASAAAPAAAAGDAVSRAVAEAAWAEREREWAAAVEALKLQLEGALADEGGIDDAASMADSMADLESLPDEERKRKKEEHERERDRRKRQRASDRKRMVDTFACGIKKVQLRQPQWG